ncbi:MAG: hypothetical protein ACFCBW_13070, partial [Candidatus Competibacterales bacterium]
DPPPPNRTTHDLTLEPEDEPQWVQRRTGSTVRQEFQHSWQLIARFASPPDPGLPVQVRLTAPHAPAVVLRATVSDEGPRPQGEVVLKLVTPPPFDLAPYRRGAGIARLRQPSP